MVAGIAGLCAFSGFAAIRIASGPISLPFLADYMGEMASTGPTRLSVAEAAIDFTAADGPTVIVREANLTIAGETPVEVFLPHVEAPLRTRELLTGNIGFGSLALDRPRVRLGVSGAATVTAPSMDSLVEAIDRVSEVVDAEFARRSLSFIDVRNGEVVLVGPTEWRSGGIDANVRRDEDGTITALARVAGNAGPWELEFLRASNADAAERRIALAVRGITFREVLDPDQTIKSGKGLGLPVDITFDSRLGLDGTFKSANLVGRMRNGWFQLGRTSVRFDDAALSLLWREGKDAIQVLRSHVIRGNTQVYLTGEIAPPGDSGNDWTVRLATETAQFGSSDIPDPPVRIDAAQLVGRFSAQDRTLYFDTVRIRAGNADFQMVGSVQIGADGPYLGLAAHAEQVPIAIAKQLWPITLVPPARRWIIDRIKTGLIEKASYTAAIRPPAFDQSDPDAGWSGNDMLLDMSFSGARVAPIGTVPEARGLNGTLRIADETLTIEAVGGTVAAEDTAGQVVDVPELTFRIFDLPLRVGKEAALETRLEGATADIGTIVDSEPFRVLERAGLVGNGLSGESSMVVEARFPLKRKIVLDDVDWQAEAVTSGFSAREPIKGHVVSNADVVVQVDPTQVSITGKGELDGLPADIDLLLPLGGSGVEARQGVSLEVTTEKLKERGIDLTAFVNGPVSMQVRDESGDREFVVDLAEAEVALTPLGWAKAAGVPAEATFRLRETETERQIEDFTLTADGVDVSGSIRLSADGDVVSASFARFRLRPDDDASLSIQRSGPDAYKVAMVGSSFDARGLIRQMRASGSDVDGGFAQSLSITANFSKVTGYNGTRLDEFTGTVETNSEGVRSATLTGTLNGRAPLEFTMSPDGEGRRAAGTFQDAGALLSFLDLYERMRGGIGQLNAVLPTATDWTGQFSVRELSITNDPAIQRLRERPGLLADRSDPGRVLIGGGDLGGGNASFETLEIVFARTGDILTIERGALQGAVFGGTVSGSVDLKTQTLDLAGTFVPIYALNNIFAKIPVLGFALGGNTGEGLIGVTYRLSGALTDPVLAVNPVSAIAPGIFRRMFEFQ